MPRVLSVVATAGIATVGSACFSPDDEPMSVEGGSEDDGGADDVGDDAPTTEAPGDDGSDGEGDGGSGDTGGPSDDDGDAGDGDSDGSDDESDSGDDTDGGDDVGPGEDTGEPMTVPAIVEITPADGAMGVHEDASIVVRFSEPMDKAATQAAYQSVDLPAAAVTFAWNDAGDELTITPNAPLEYAEGDDPSATDAISYAFTLTTAAESELGEALGADSNVTFSTLRRLTQSFEDDPELSGRVQDLGGAALIGGSYLLGDVPNNDVARGFISFDVSGLAEGPVTVESANFHARWSNTVGNPFIDLGAVVYQHVAYDTFDNALFDAPGIGSASNLFATALETEADRDVAEVVEEVLADEATYGQRVQFRTLWIFSETDGDGQSDGVTFIASDSALDLTYLAP